MSRRGRQNKHWRVLSGGATKAVETEEEGTARMDIIPPRKLRALRVEQENNENTGGVYPAAI
ncbi:MAG: hypothetical protein OEY86_18640 [Nitrospira sp.]|nr:hypothetical protein [Nitrospira sp.]